jgi:hypothetical protein
MKKGMLGSGGETLIPSRKTQHRLYPNILVPLPEQGGSELMDAKTVQLILKEAKESFKRNQQ